MIRQCFRIWPICMDRPRVASQKWRSGDDWSCAPQQSM